MPKRRMLNPLMWQDPEFGTLTEKEQLLFIGCLSNADDEGRLRGHPALLRAMIFPYNSQITIEEVQEIRNEIAKKMKNFLSYKINGDEYIQFTKWKEHQVIRPDRITKSVIPLPLNYSSLKLKVSIREKNLNDKEINISFNDFWNLYDKKIGLKNKIEKKWNKLNNEERKAIMKYIPIYKEAQPEKRFRKNPETFFNNRSWEDELISNKKLKKRKVFFQGDPVYEKNGKQYVVQNGEWREFVGDEKDLIVKFK